MLTSQPATTTATTIPTRSNSTQPAPNEKPLLTVDNVENTPVSLPITHDLELIPATEQSTSSLSKKFGKLIKFIERYGPNHLILQFGPQIHNSLTGSDFKFTPTLVLFSDHLEAYPLHNEIGHTIPTGSDAVKAYALAVKQQGINIAWPKLALNYIRQELVRIEMDIPYGNLGLQATIGLELGITDTTTDPSHTLQHAIQDFKTSSAQAFGLVAADFTRQRSLINTLVAILVMPEILTRLSEHNHDRARTLWFGLSLGYADYNGNIAENIQTLPDPQHNGINIQSNVYTRHGQMMTYDCQNRQFTIPHVFAEILLVFYRNKSNLISDVLKNKTYMLKNNQLPPRAKEISTQFLDELAFTAATTNPVTATTPV